MALNSGKTLGSMKIGALLNTSSGSCGAGAEAELERILADAGLRAHHTWCGGGDEIGQALEGLADQGLDLLIVLGGDGTIRSAAQKCTGAGPLLAPLPGGTMNMLPKGLYGDQGWQAALQATLKDPGQRPVSGGEVEGRRFYVASIFGSPSLWAQAREAVRAGDLGQAVSQGVNALSKSFRKPLGYAFEGRNGEAEALSILCPLTSRAMDNDAGALEVAVMTPKGALDTLSLGLRAVFAEWRADPNVETACVERIEITSDEPIAAILDGETVELPPRVEVAFIKTAFIALIPAPGPSPGKANAPSPAPT